MDVQWIKITTDMFDNRKIRHLRKLPDGDRIVLIWVMLLTMAGRSNAGGFLYLTDRIPYTTSMIANELDFEESTVQLALEAMERLDMLTATEDGICISGWEEHQNKEKLDRIREQNRLRKRKEREVKAISGNNSATERDKNVTERDKNVTVTQQNKREREERDSEIESEEEYSPLNYPTRAGSALPVPDAENVENVQNSVQNLKLGANRNVRLMQTQYENLMAAYPETFAYTIERLSDYIAQTGKYSTYKNHAAVLMTWAEEDAQ